jgi:hypothetical protein
MQGAPDQTPPGLVGTHQREEGSGHFTLLKRSANERVNQ